MKESSMRGVFSIVFVAGLTAVAVAQPAGSGAGSGPPAGSASSSGSATVGSAAAPVAGSGPAIAPVAGSGSAAASAGSAASGSGETPPISTGEAHQLRKTCVTAIQANKELATDIVKWAVDQGRTLNAFCANVDTIAAHKAADAHVKKNERHVIMAYAAMWVIAAVFLLYMFRRQQSLKSEIAQLRRDLDAAAKDEPGRTK